MGFRVWGLGFRVKGVGFRVWGLGFRVPAASFYFLGVWHCWGCFVLAPSVEGLEPQTPTPQKLKPQNPEPVQAKAETLNPTWTPKVCEITACMAIIIGLGLLSCILLGLRYGPVNPKP